MQPASPDSTAELLQRARQLAGFTLAELAAELNQQLPADLQKDKGTVGQLLELALGASAGSKAEPDFPHLGVELKTIPIDRSGKPLESTYVCVAPMTGAALQRWEVSWVCRKLQHVLWVPVLAERGIPLAERMIGRAFLWQPSAEQQQLLRQDWEELMDMIVLGSLDTATGEFEVRTAGHPPAAQLDAGSGRWTVLEGVGPVLGLIEDAEFTVVRGLLRSGDALLLYTDGLVERRHEDLCDGLARLVESGTELAGVPVEELCDALMARMAPEYADDVALVALHARPQEPPAR